MYFTDRGLEELAERRGDEQVSLAWLAERLRQFVDLNPDFEVPVERLATWLARLDDDDEIGVTRTGGARPHWCGGRLLLPPSSEVCVNTRSIATIALVIAVLLLLFLVVLPRL